MKHTLLSNPRLKGWEYGMLRALECEIVTQTSATVVHVPDYGAHFITDRILHGTRWSFGRSLMPKKELGIHTDVLWYVLMGPENYELDLFKNWNVKAAYRIVYLFDTFESQFELIKKLFSDNSFNILITSFADAVPELERITGKKWNTIEQAVPEDLFKPVDLTERVIDFCSYGRRLNSFHNIVKEFCKSSGLYYDYTTHDRSRPSAPEEELYRQYAWHLNHSKFNVSWPVELTHPSRAGKLNPVTCRWFEAAAAGTVILGKKPSNSGFDQLLSRALIVEIDPFEERKVILKNLEIIFSNRFALLEKAEVVRKDNLERWTWKERVNRILSLLSICSFNSDKSYLCTY